jgi:hypothetical protein
MAHLAYQRTVIAYHGCDESVARRVLLDGEKLEASENDYDWLGHGIYFWEHGKQRALEWAIYQAKRGRKIRQPIQIAVRDHGAIVGYFKPNLDNLPIRLFIS